MSYTLPVGLCSRRRAEYLMSAAATAGGAIYVDLPPIPGLTEGPHGEYYGDLLCCGTLPSGEAVPTSLLEPSQVLQILDDLASAGPGTGWYEAGLTTPTRAVADDLRTKLAASEK